MKLTYIPQGERALENPNDYAINGTPEQLLEWLRDDIIEWCLVENEDEADELPDDDLAALVQWFNANCDEWQVTIQQ